ncbi:hypothetical protein GCM10009119_19500 [Algoriphagus jejuensis]|uniref:PepSY-associated transmembrane protein n=1 Tax=Algoriphagus jejuensis TaxID=419934 RepID=A0ABP3YEP4_9BACT
MALPKQDFINEIRNVKYTAMRGEDYYCLKKMSGQQRVIAFFEFHANKLYVRDYDDKGYYPSFHFKPYRPTPKWVKVLVKSLGFSMLLTIILENLYSYGYFGADKIWFLSFILFFAMGNVYVYFIRKNKPKKPPRYADPVRMEKYRMRYKELTGRDYEGD